jgi:hypothetical protein
MFKKALPVLFLAAFIAAPVASPALAKGDDAAKKCEKIQDVKKRAACLEMVKSTKK